MDEQVKPWRYEVEADSSGVWYGNGVTFASEAEAEAAARDLMGRWTLVRQYRVVPTETPRNQLICRD